MIFQNIQIIYYMNGRKVFNQSGETDIKTIEANKSFLQEMFSIFNKDAEIEVVAELNTKLDDFCLQFVCLN